MVEEGDADDELVRDAESELEALPDEVRDFEVVRVRLLEADAESEKSGVSDSWAE